MNFVVQTAKNSNPLEVFGDMILLPDILCMCHCVNMHQNISKCIQNELCKCFVHKIIKEVFLLNLNALKLTNYFCHFDEGA